MRDPLLQELFPFVFGLVESYDSFYVPLSEYLAVLLRGEARPLPGLPAVDGPHKGGELARDDPVDVPVVHALVVLVLLHIEGLEVVPLVLDALLQALQAVQDRALVVALALGGIAEWHELAVV
mgnify:CR=1 FL=1